MRAQRRDHTPMLWSQVSSVTLGKWQNVWVLKSWRAGARSSLSSRCVTRQLFLIGYPNTVLDGQVVNYSHLFPTRYALELEALKGSVEPNTFKEPTQREEAKKIIKKLFEERYNGGKNKWFFTPLRVRIILRTPSHRSCWSWVPF